MRDFVDEAFANYNSNLPDNQDTCVEVENNKIAEAFHNEYPAENQELSNASDSISGIGMSHILSDDQSWTKNCRKIHEIQ